MNRFSPGAHLQVRRGIYYHHGVYISDDRVIQFGSGASLRDKHSTRIDAVTLADFEQGGTAVVVRHGYESWFTGHHPAADEPWKVIARAEFLLKLQPGLPYNLIGHNCEIIANMCASGSWTESYQVRRGFGVRAYTSSNPALYRLARPQETSPARLAIRMGNHRVRSQHCRQDDLQPRDQKALGRDSRRLARSRAHARGRSAQRAGLPERAYACTSGPSRITRSRRRHAGTHDHPRNPLAAPPAHLLRRPGLLIGSAPFQRTEIPDGNLTARPLGPIQERQMRAAA